MKSPFKCSSCKKNLNNGDDGSGDCRNEDTTEENSNEENDDEAHREQYDQKDENEDNDGMWSVDGESKDNDRGGYRKGSHGGYESSK